MATSTSSYKDLYVEQVELLRGIRDLCEQIMNTYKPHVYLYVGIGRSPAPLMAYFQNRLFRSFTIPLSDFRRRNMKWSITDDVLTTSDPQLRRRIIGLPRITQDQQRRLFSHFGTYFQSRPERGRLLLIDYTQSGQSLIAAQEQLQAFFQERNWSEIEVHALAICRDSDEPKVTSVGEHVGGARRLLEDPLDWWLRSDQRMAFANRWHVLPIAQSIAQRDSQRDSPTRRQELVMKALAGQAFDDLAEYGSFKILEGTEAQRTRYTTNPNEPAAYNVLRDELRGLKSLSE